MSAVDKSSRIMFFFLLLLHSLIALKGLRLMYQIYVSEKSLTCYWIWVSSTEILNKRTEWWAVVFRTFYCFWHVSSQMNWQSISGMKEAQGFISLKKFHSVSLGFYQTQCIFEVIIGPSNKTLLLTLSVCLSTLSKRTFWENNTIMTQHPFSFVFVFVYALGITRWLPRTFCLLLLLLFP